jgi:hypothetical protein
MIKTLKRTFVIFLFIILAPLAVAGDVTGQWTYDETTGVQVMGHTRPGAHETVTITLKADGNTLTGTVTHPRTGARNVPDVKHISHGQIDGNNLTFETVGVLFGTQMITHWSGTLDGDIINFTINSGGGGPGTKIEAHRQAAPTN